MKKKKLTHFNVKSYLHRKPFENFVFKFTIDKGYTKPCFRRYHSYYSCIPIIFHELSSNVLSTYFIVLYGIEINNTSLFKIYNIFIIIKKT